MPEANFIFIVELVIVIAVIAILAAVMIPTFSSVVTNAKESAALQKAKAAYTNTLAEDLSDNDDSNNLVYGETVIIADGTIKIEITSQGVANIYKGQSAATLKVDGEKLVPINPAS